MVYIVFFITLLFSGSVFGQTVNYQRFFYPDTAVSTGDTVWIDIQITNNESDTLKGLVFADQIPSNIAVIDNGIRINESPYNEYTYEKGNSGEVYSSRMPHRWIFQKPPGFTETGFLLPGDSTTIEYGLTTNIDTSFSFNKEAWYSGLVSADSLTPLFGYDSINTINISFSSPVNHPPEILNQIPDTVIYEDSNDSVICDNLDNVFSDIDGDSLFYNTLSDTGIYTTITNDSLIIDLYPNFNGDVQLIVIASDNYASISDTVEIQIIDVNDPPMTFGLFKPTNGDTLFDNQTPVDFIWYSSNNVDNDTINYTLKIFKTDQDTLIENIVDTSFSFNGNDFWLNNNFFYWTVVAYDSQYYINSTDTFSFFIPLVDKIYNHQNYIPKTYSLSQNYPNPFNPKTTIKFGLPEPGLVKIDILDVRGRVIKNLLNQYQAAGLHKFDFETTGLASGVYLYKIEVDKKFRMVRKMIYLK